jgi:cyclase
MANMRLIARLDIKGENLIKSINLEGIRVIGNPNQHAIKYYHDHADEILFMDSVASLYGRNNLESVIREATKSIFVPITVGGGIRSVEDAERMLLAGADKIALNTAAIHRPKLIEEIASRFGNQCVVVSIEAKFINKNNWEAYVDCGREKTGKNAVEWAKHCFDLGAGEILATSIDREGTRLGFDIELMQEICNVVNIPVIASGGFGKIDHLIDIKNNSSVDGIAIADAIHYNRMNLSQIRADALSRSISVRKV